MRMEVSQLAGMGADGVGRRLAFGAQALGELAVDGEDVGRVGEGGRDLAGARAVEIFNTG